MNGARELHLFAGKVAVGILGELLAQDENTVERRAQLVGHVRKELGLVLGSQGELGGLFFDRTARLFDFLVLRFHLDVAVGQLLRLLFQLLVGLLQLALLRLQFGGQLLRLFEQTFGLHGGFDGFEHNADGIGQLVQEGHLQLREGAQRGQFDDGLHPDLRTAPAAPRCGRGGARNNPEVMGITLEGMSVISTRRATKAHWPMSPSPARKRSA